MAMQIEEYILKKNTTNQPTRIGVNQVGHGWDVVHIIDNESDKAKMKKIGHINPAAGGVMLKTGETYRDLETAVDAVVEEHFQ